MKIKTKRPKEVIDPAIGKRLRMRRMILGISQKELSEAVNVSVKQIQKYENSTSPIAGSVLLVFSKLLNTPIQYFINSQQTDLIDNEYLFQDSISQSTIVAEEGEGYNPRASNVDNSGIEDSEMVTLLELLCVGYDHASKKKILKLAKSIVAS